MEQRVVLKKYSVLKRKQIGANGEQRINLRTNLTCCSDINLYTHLFLRKMLISA